MGHGQPACQRRFCGWLKKAGIYEAFASVVNDFKLECRDDQTFAVDATTSFGMIAGRTDAEGRTNWVVRVDHKQNVTSPNPRDGGPAGERVNAKMAQLLGEYDIDEIIADDKYAHVFQRAGKFKDHWTRSAPSGSARS